MMSKSSDVCLEHPLEDDRSDAHAPDHAIQMRLICIGGLMTGAFAGVSIATFGAYVLVREHPSIYLNLSPSYETYAEQNILGNLTSVLKIIVTAVVTLIVQCTGYAHTVSLRWSLYLEGRLTFNSNLRLFTSTRSHGPHKWYTNVLFMLCNILAYASATTIFWPYYTGKNDVITGQGLCAGGLQCVALGLTVLAMCAISTWSISVTDIASWSSSPLKTTEMAIESKGVVRGRQGRCMMSVLESHLPGAPSKPRRRQRGFASLSHVRWLLPAQFIVVCIYAAIAVAWCSGYRQSSGTDAPQWSPADATLAYPMFAPMKSSYVGNAISMLMICAAIQSPITIFFHVAELFINMSRDEKYWRRASSERGCSIVGYSSIRAAFGDPWTVLLNLLRIVAHWQFSCSIVSARWGWIYQVTCHARQREALLGSFTNVVWVTVSLLLCTLVVASLSYYRPNGPQPASYGHIQTLADLVDEWSPTLYWGHKEDGDPCHAGTSQRHLSPVRMDNHYSGHERRTVSM